MDEPAVPAWPLPRVWCSYRPVASPDRDFADLRSHGVDCVSCDPRTVPEAREALRAARRAGITYHIAFPEITENAPLVREAGFVPAYAQLIGGCCRGRAIDRHLFSLAPARHTLGVEPPVYHRAFAYGRPRRAGDDGEAGEPIGHYYPDMPPPLRAEVVVPLRPFDGTAHVEILDAEVREAPPGSSVDADSVTADMPLSRETANRRLFALTFDLSPYRHAMLDHVGLAVYWEYHGTDQYWIYGTGTVSACADSTREALRRHVRRILDLWVEANDGAFPGDVVRAARFGDECFYVTGHSHSLHAAVSYPLWDFSPPSVEAFRRLAGPAAVHPRTWGFPEIYGADACAWWLYGLHKGCAELCDVVRRETVERVGGLPVFRNTTRMGVFDFCNEHDGSGQELLARSLDVVHLDPYPVSGKGYGAEIPRDMSYCAGLARRLRKPLIPWMQAHTYGGPDGLQHVAPEHVRRMASEQLRHGVDGVIWLGYGPRYTFPDTRPDSWEEAGRFHRRLRGQPPARPDAGLAVLRGYRARAVCSAWGDGVRNPADWLLQQFLEVWAVEFGLPYDVFELPPALSDCERDELARELERYPRWVSTELLGRAWTIGAGTEGTAIAAADADRIRAEFRRELIQRGWV